MLVVWTSVQQELFMWVVFRLGFASSPGIFHLSVVGLLNSTTRRPAIITYAHCSQAGCDDGLHVGSLVSVCEYCR
jgi:hypothetical protein